MKLVQVLTSLLLVALCMRAHVSRAQELPGQITVADARPSFTILPLLQELEARPGERVKFSFTLESQKRAARLNVQIVGLRQDESGLIVPDEEGPPPGNVQLYGPSVIQLRPDTEYALEGFIILPLDVAASISYGVLVTDLGQMASGATDDSENKVLVRFVTRYLLRVHIKVSTARPIQPSDLDVLAAELVEEEGRCLARVRLRNPRQGTCDVAVRCRLIPESGPALDPPFFLVLPIRRGTEDQRRPACKVLGQTTVHLESIVPHPVVPGPYRLEVESSTGRLPYHRLAYGVSVAADQFPDHAQSVLQIAGLLRVEPSQMELSLKPRGDRLTRVTISNTSRRQLDVHLAALSPEGNPLPWAIVRPASFPLASGASRNVLVGIQQASGVHNNLYGELSVLATTSDGTIAARRPLQLAVLAPGDFQPSFDVAAVRFAQTTSRASLVTAIQNQGQIHLELGGRLKLVSPSGEVTEMNARSARWLLPGHTGELHFPFHSLPEPGNYRLVGEITSGGTPLYNVDRDLHIPVVTTPVSTPTPLPITMP